MYVCVQLARTKRCRLLSGYFCWSPFQLLLFLFFKSKMQSLKCILFKLDSFIAFLHTNLKGFCGGWGEKGPWIGEPKLEAPRDLFLYAYNYGVANQYPDPLIRPYVCLCPCLYSQIQWQFVPFATFSWFFIVNRTITKSSAKLRQTPQQTPVLRLRILGVTQSQHGGNFKVGSQLVTQPARIPDSSRACHTPSVEIYMPRRCDSINGICVVRRNQEQEWHSSSSSLLWGQKSFSTRGAQTAGHQTVRRDMHSILCKEIKNLYKLCTMNEQQQSRRTVRAWEAVCPALARTGNAKNCCNSTLLLVHNDNKTLQKYPAILILTYKKYILKVIAHTFLFENIYAHLQVQLRIWNTKLFLIISSADTHRGADLQVAATKVRARTAPVQDIGSGCVDVEILRNPESRLPVQTN